MECIQCGINKIGENSKTGASSCSPCDSGTYQTQPGVCKECSPGRYQDGKGSLECLECPKDTYLSIEAAKSKAECTECDNDRSTGLTKGNTNKASCLCKRTEFYTDANDKCQPCPDGADCSAKDGLVLGELTAKPGYWRPDLTTDPFSPCVVGYSSLDAQELADARCCPNNITNSSICSNKKFNHTNEQCKKEYAGTLCLVCANGYVKLGTTCIECAAGASMGMAAVPLLGVLLGLFIILMIFFKYGKKASSKATSANKWFGQAKIMLVSSIVSFL